MNSQEKLREKWPWNREFLRLYLLIPTVIGFIATVAIIPFAGAQALWFLTAILAGAVIYLVYGLVGRRVDALKSEFGGTGGEIAEAQIVIGKLQSPGIVVLKSNEIELSPIIREAAHNLPDGDEIGRRRQMATG